MEIEGAVVTYPSNVVIDEKVKGMPTRQILIVEDDENVAQGICRALTLHGYVAETCNSAEAALEKLGQSGAAWALVISDLRLPGGDGQQLLQNVAENWPGIRRVLITGFGTAETELWARGEADDYLVKPFSTQRLLQTVQRLVPPYSGVPVDA